MLENLIYSQRQSFGRVHQSSQISTRSVNRGQFCTKNKTHGYEFYHKNLCKKRDVTEQRTTLEWLLAPENPHIRRHIQRLCTSSNCLIGWTYNSSVTIKKKRVSMKGTHVAVQIWPRWNENCCRAWFPSFDFSEFPFKSSSNTPENYILSQTIDHTYDQFFL